MPTATVPRKGLQDRVHQTVLGWLRDGTLPAGSMLSEHDLATRLGVSRTPVRAALRQLETAGWLTIYPQRGALVKEVGAREAAEVSQARLVLESSFVDLLEPGDRAQFCERLRAMVEEQEAEAADGSYDELVQLTIDFHRAFVEVGQNSILLAFYDRMRDRQSLMTLRTQEQVEGRWQDFIAEHRELVDLFAAGDRSAFTSALQAHIVHTHGSLMN